MLLKKAAAFALHNLGGLAILRRHAKQRPGIPVFHAFSEATGANVEAFCQHLTRHFEPVSLSTLVSGAALPGNAMSVTIDDGYRNFLQHGHPIFRRHRIPTTLYAVSGFADGRLWLWPDQIVFGLKHTPHRSLRVEANACGQPFDLVLTTEKERATSATALTEALKLVPDAQRLRFLSGWGALCGVEIPVNAPPEHAAMTWEELRAVSAEGVEVGCHTETHPILSRIPSQNLDREIGGAQTEIEQRLHLPVRHFCYPNGRPIDVNEAAVTSVREAGFASAVTCSWGFNSAIEKPFQLSRLPLDSTLAPAYQAEVLAGTPFLVHQIRELISSR